MPRTPQSKQRRTWARTIEDVIEPAKIRKINLLDAHPEVAVEWFYKKNCGFGPEDFNYASSIKVWWQCSNDKKHSWKTSIANRTTRDSGCPTCNQGEKTDLKDYPEAFAQFDNKLNRGVSPHNVAWHAKLHWKCTKNKYHTWVGTFNRRTGERCPYCKKIKLSKSNSLATLNPKLAKQLHPTKNMGLTAKDLRSTERRRVWWKCPQGSDHEWEALISTRAFGRGDGLGCPFCVGRYVSVTNCLSTLHPQVAKEWHPSKNKPKTPKDVTGQTADKFWWRCAQGHDWYQGVAIRTVRGANCPICKNWDRAPKPP